MQVGNNDSGGSLETGAVENDGTLIFSRANSGLGFGCHQRLRRNNKQRLGDSQLAGTNTFDGTVIVSAGILKANNNSALGSTNGSTTIISGASLDVGGRNLGQEQIFVSGSGTAGGAANGTIFNSGGTASPGLARVTLPDHHGVRR